MLPALDWARKNVYNKGREFLFKKTLENADRIVVVNDETADLYAQFTSRSKIETIPYGVVCDRFKRGTPKDSVDMLAMGSLYKRKGYDVLIEAWSQVVSEFPDSTLHILGNGPLGEYLEQRIAELNIDANVILHGFVEREKVVEMFSSVRAFVHPSRSEGFPHVRLEAMASACPVIATNVTGTSEMIRHGTDGLVIPTGEIEPLAAAMTELLNNPEEAQRMGENALHRVREEFDWNDISKKFIEIYQEEL
jgi:glycosyltransferase involved in cell wall biosynthesis